MSLIDNELLMQDALRMLGKEPKTSGIAKTKISKAIQKQIASRCGK